MRILNLQNTILVSLLVAGAAASVACGSSDATRPGDGTAGTGNSSSGGSGNATSTAGTGNSTAGTGNSSSSGGTGSGTAGSSSGTAGSGGAAAPSVCDGVASRVLTNTPADAFIDDLETLRDGNTDPTSPGPAWYGFNDVTPSNSIKPVRAAGGALNTGFFVHYSGTGAKTPVNGGFGVGLEINLGVDPTNHIYCVDASAFTGVSFWAKAANSTNAKITAGFVTPQQNMVMNNGDCPDSDAAGCNNYPQKAFTLTTDWQQYTVDFATAVGTKGAKVVAGKVQQVLWLAPTSDWDFSVDEVAFYSGTAPTGPVAPPSDGTGGTGAGGSGAGGSSAGGTGGSQ